MRFEFLKIGNRKQDDSTSDTVESYCLLFLAFVKTRKFVYMYFDLLMRNGLILENDIILGYEKVDLLKNNSE